MSREVSDRVEERTRRAVGVNGVSRTVRDVDTSVDIVDGDAPWSERQLHKAVDDASGRDDVDAPAAGADVEIALVIGTDCNADAYFKVAV
jgi:hypothetical protein